MTLNYHHSLIFLNIEDNIHDKYKDKYKINRFLRNTEFNYAMRTKLNNCIFFNKYKQK